MKPLSIPTSAGMVQVSVIAERGVWAVHYGPDCRTFHVTHMPTGLAALKGLRSVAAATALMWLLPLSWAAGAQKRRAARQPSRRWVERFDGWERVRDVQRAALALMADMPEVE